jgi:hypothetical protein
VRVGGLKHGIGRVPHLTYQNGDHHDAAYGTFDPQKVLIWLDSDNGPEREKVTLVHEVLHAVISAARLEIEDEDEEKMVGRTAPILLDFIRSNRGAIAFLQES